MPAGPAYRSIARIALATLALLPVRTAVAAECRPCVFGGTCGTGAGVPCGPVRARCRPNEGILVFRSVTDGAPAYWTLFADRSETRGRLDGELQVWADGTLPLPMVPGFSGPCDVVQCQGASADFQGRVRRNRLRATAAYADGSRCDFVGDLVFGRGGSRPNAYVCRSGTGAVLSRGGFDLQGIRLLGCRRR